MNTNLKKQVNNLNAMCVEFEERLNDFSVFSTPDIKGLIKRIDDFDSKFTRAVRSPTSLKCEHDAIAQQQNQFKTIKEEFTDLVITSIEVTLDTLKQHLSPTNQTLLSSDIEYDAFSETAYIDHVRVVSNLIKAGQHLIKGDNYSEHFGAVTHKSFKTVCTLASSHAKCLIEHKLIDLKQINNNLSNTHYNLTTIQKGIDYSQHTIQILFDTWKQFVNDFKLNNIDAIWENLHNDYTNAASTFGKIVSIFNSQKWSRLFHESIQAYIQDLKPYLDETHLKEALLIMDEQRNTLPKQISLLEEKQSFNTEHSFEITPEMMSNDIKNQTAFWRSTRVKWKSTYAETKKDDVSLRYTLAIGNNFKRIPHHWVDMLESWHVSLAPPMNMTSQSSTFLKKEGLKML